MSFPAPTISWRLNGVPVAADEVETVADARNPKLHLSEIRISAKRAEQGEVVECIADGESNLCLSVGLSGVKFGLHRGSVHPIRFISIVCVYPLLTPTTAPFTTSLLLRLYSFSPRPFFLFLILFALFRSGRADGDVAFEPVPRGFGRGGVAERPISARRPLHHFGRKPVVLHRDCRRARLLRF